MALAARTGVFSSRPDVKSLVYGLTFDKDANAQFDPGGTQTWFGQVAGTPDFPDVVMLMTGTNALNSGQQAPFLGGDPAAANAAVNVGAFVPAESNDAASQLGRVLNFVGRQTELHGTGDERILVSKLLPVARADGRATLTQRVINTLRFNSGYEAGGAHIFDFAAGTAITAATGGGVDEVVARQRSAVASRTTVVDLFRINLFELATRISELGLVWSAEFQAAFGNGSLSGDGDPYIDWLFNFDEAWSTQAAINATSGGAGVDSNWSLNPALWDDDLHPSRLGYEVMALAYHAALSEGGTLSGIPEPGTAAAVLSGSAGLLCLRRRRAAA